MRGVRRPHTDLRRGLVHALLVRELDDVVRRVGVLRLQHLGDLVAQVLLGQLQLRVGRAGRRVRRSARRREREEAGGEEGGAEGEEEGQQGGGRAHGTARRWAAVSSGGESGGGETCSFGLM